MSGVPIVTVVIATRNRRALLSETIATVLDQSIADFELLIVDDASTDDTARYAATLRDPRIRAVLIGTHGERSAARNRGLAEARGAFVMFLDDDDLLRADALAVLTQGLRAHPDAVAAIAPCRVSMVNGDSLKPFWPSRAVTRIIWKELLSGFWASSGQALYRRELVRQVGGYPSHPIPCEDRAMWLALARLGPVHLARETVMDYRIHAGQSKPPNLAAIRHKVWADFIAGLPPRERPAAKRIRRAADRIDAAERARRDGRFAAAIAGLLAACCTAPYLATSPITARPIWWGLKKSLLRRRAP